MPLHKAKVEKLSTLYSNMAFLYIGSITVTVILQAAISGGSGEEWSTLHCNTEYSHGWHYVPFIGWIEVSVQSKCLLVRKFCFQIANTLAREYLQNWYSCYDTFHYRHTASYCPKCVLMFCCVCTDL